MSLSLDLGRVARVVVGNPGTTDSKKSEEEENSKAASADSTAESSADSTAADEAGKAATLSRKTSDEKYNVTVQYGSDAAIPADASLKITELKEESKAFKNARDAVVEEKKKADKDFDEKAMGMAALDISILDQDGNAVEPAKGAKVDVQIELTKLPETTDSKSLKDSLEVQHIKGDVATTVADTAAKADGEITVDDGTATADFSVDHFSTFAVTWDQQLETNVLTADGKTYKITAEYNDDAGIPKGSKLEAKEVTGSDKKEYVDETSELVYGGSSENTLSWSKYFDISIEHNGKKVEPADGSYVKVTITTSGIDNISGDVNVVHFKDNGDPEMIPADRNEDGSVTYYQSSFSPVGLFEAKPVLFGENRLMDDSTGDSEGPTHSKTLTDNHDGTYNLTLSVTGKASSSTTKSKADVVIVFDKSDSMQYPVNYASDSGKYGWRLKDKTYYQLYKMVNYRTAYPYYANKGDRDDKFFEPIENGDDATTLYRIIEWGHGSYTGYYGYSFDGPRYTEIDTSNNGSPEIRLTTSKNAINALASELLANNNGVTDVNEANVTLSLVTFAQDATTEIERTTSEADFQSCINNVETAEGTNWEDALRKAYAVNTREGAEKYIIFVSDGNPTFYGSGHGTESEVGSGYETSDNVATCYTYALTALNNKDTNFYGVGVYGNVDRMQGLVSEAGADASHYQVATDQASLNAAFAKIIKSITNTATFDSVVMTDHVTDLTSMSVDDGKVTDFTYTRGGKTWEGAPEATFDPNTKQVVWNLGSTTVENGITYAVSFKVWPSQRAYDLVANLNNGKTTYEQLSDTEKSQIVQQNGQYYLKTNQGKNTIAYDRVETVKNGDVSTTTRTPGTGKFEDPNPIPLTNAQVTVKKIWDDGLDKNAERPDVNFLVGYDENNDEQITSDDSNAVNVTLGNDEGTTKTLEHGKTVWSKSIAVAPGLIVNGETLEPGHDYQILEETSLDDYAGSSSGAHPMLYNSATSIKNQAGSGEAVLSVTNTLIKKDIIIKKTSADGKTLLSGAEFTLTKGETTEAATAESGIGDDGKITIPDSGEIAIKGLPVGDYTLTETKAPDGYIIQSGGIKFTVSKDGITLKDTEDTAATADGLTLTVKNNAGTALPNTGSTGTLPYALGGLAIIAMAALMYGFVLRRNNRERRFK